MSALATLPTCASPDEAKGGKCLDLSYLHHGLSEVLPLYLRWFLLWTCLFYLLVFTEKYWFRRLPASSKPHENNKYWVAMQVVSFVHSIFITVMALPSFLVLLTSPDHFAFPPHPGSLPWCTVPDQPIVLQYKAYEQHYVGLGVAGMAFTMHVCSDLVVTVLHGLTNPQMMIHHAAFIAVGLIIRSNCLLPFNSGALMAMETSTPFLNFLMVFRNRGDGFARYVEVATKGFLGFFLIFRIFVNTYGVFLLWRYKDAIIPTELPAWQAWVMVLAVTAGAFIQYFFLWQIITNFLPKGGDKAGRKKKNDEDSDEDRRPVRKLSDHINADGTW